MVTGDTSKHDSGKKDGDFDGSGIYMRRWAEWERFEREKLAADLMKDMNNMAVLASQANVPLRPFDQDQYVTAAVEQAETQSAAAKDRAKKSRRSLDDPRLKAPAFINTRAPPRESWIMNAGSTVSLASPEMTSASTRPPLR